jgi:hypothetical protein
LKKAGIDTKSSVCKYRKKPICNKPRTWLVDNTVAAQSFSEWWITNNTCLKPNEKGDFGQGCTHIHIYYEVNYKLCTSRTPSCPSQSISSVCSWNRPLVRTEEHKWLERCDQEVGILNLYYGLVSWLGDWLSTLETFCGFLLTPEPSFSWQPHNIGILTLHSHTVKVNYHSLTCLQAVQNGFVLCLFISVTFSFGLGPHKYHIRPRELDIQKF